MPKLIFVIVFLLISNSCQAQSGKPNITDVQDEIMEESELRKTTDRAIEFIQSKDYSSFKDLLALDLMRNPTDTELKNLVDQLNAFISSEGLPKNENIVPTLQATINGTDTVFVNRILYQYKNLENYGDMTLSFSFLKEHGYDKIIGVFLEGNPLQSNDQKPSVKPLKSFQFDIYGIDAFRIYYDEGENRITKFNNHVGIFAIQGDFDMLIESGLDDIYENIFNELEKVEIETIRTFNTNINRGEDSEFIQTEFLSEEMEGYSILVYVPISNKNEEDKYLIVRQNEYANLGYEYLIDKKNCENIVLEFSKIKDLPLSKFYLPNP